MTLKTTHDSLLALARSFLFVPAHRPERYQKALSSGADAIIIDLEDALPIPEKDAGRVSLLEAWPSLSAHVQCQVLVRINPMGTPWYSDDVSLLTRLEGLGAVMLPKTESSEHIRDITQRTSGLRVLPLIETAKGVSAVEKIAAAQGVVRLGLGHIDLQADLGMSASFDEHELAPARWAMVVASRVSGIPAPVDGVTTSTQAESVWLEAAQRSRRFGFGGKLCIHPNQIKGVHLGFAPLQKEVDWAQKVVEAEANANGGAFSVDGKMVDAPVVLMARQVLAKAARPV
jgi:citrate lyase subunit beta / citryl-CoA lyase